MRALSILFGILLCAEALLTGTWVASHLTTAAVYPWATVAIILVRGLVGAVQFAAGWMLMGRHSAGVLFGQWAFGTSAVLLVLELGAGLSPSSLFPTFRVPVIVGYAAYALVAIAVLRRTRA